MRLFIIGVPARFATHQSGSRFLLVKQPRDMREKGGGGMTILAVIAAIAMARTAYNGMTKKSELEDTETVLVARVEG